MYGKQSRNHYKEQRRSIEELLPKQASSSLSTEAEI